jgi:hypothetical protein
MKLSTGMILASSLNMASAFVAPSQMVSSSVLRMSEETVVDESTFVAETTPPAPVEPEMSQSMPFMARPVALDGTLAGDVGFDPLGFAKNTDDLMKYREAEIKHARLAMLAAAGW